MEKLFKEKIYDKDFFSDKNDFIRKKSDNGETLSEKIIKI